MISEKKAIKILNKRSSTTTLASSSGSGMVFDQTLDDPPLLAGALVRSAAPEQVLTKRYV